MGPVLSAGKGLDLPPGLSLIAQYGIAEARYGQPRVCITDQAPQVVRSVSQAGATEAAGLPEESLLVGRGFRDRNRTANRTPAANFRVRDPGGISYRC